MSRLRFYRQAKKLSEDLNVQLRINYPRGTTAYWKNEINRIKGFNVERILQPSIRNIKSVMVEYNDVLDGVIEFEYQGQNPDTTNIISDMYRSVNPLMDDVTYYISILRNGMPNSLYRGNENYSITKTTRRNEYYKFIWILYQVSQNNDEYNIQNNIIVQFIPEVSEIPKLSNLNDGYYNCGVAPLLFHLHKLKEQYPAKIKKLEKLNKIYKNKGGINNEDLQTISEVSGYKISVVDKLGKMWADFHPKVKNPKKTFLFTCINKHLVSEYEPVLKNVDTKEKLKFFATEYEPIVKKERKDKEIIFLDDVTDIANDNLTADIVKVRDTIMAVELDDVIYKKVFEEYEKYPEAYGDASVGKLKFLKANPEFKYYELNKYDKVLLDSNIKSFYERKCESNPNNYKYDLNKSYKSVPLNPKWKGVPKYIKYGFDVNKPFNEVPELKKYNCLLYINKEWVPIELVEGNPRVSQVMICSDETMDINIDDYTNSQFRSFVGKTFCKTTKAEWRTTDYYECMKARYELKGQIIGYTKTNDIYEITYNKLTTPWALPLIYTYIIQHQKYLFKKQYDLIKNIVDIVYCCVDGIETKQNADHLFDIGPDLTQWKHEEINMNVSQIPFEYEQMPHRIITNPTPYDKKYILPKYTHLSGAGGNGKTTFAVKLNKIYADIGYCAPTHNVCRNLKIMDSSIDAKTIYSMFNIRNGRDIHYHQTYVIDEVSMISDKDFKLIMDKIMEQKPNAQIIIVGDFAQLPPVGSEPTVKNKKINTTEFYKQFKVIESTENYRQREDPEFYKLCNKLRIENFDKKYIKSILQKLNERVLPLPDYTTENDLFICGVNNQVNNINKKYENLENKKVIVKNTFKKDNEIIPCGLEGILNKNTFTADKEYILTDNQLKNISLNYASTIHLAQGKTKSGNVIINPTRLFEKEHLYVALTRAVKLNNIYLTNKITKEQLEIMYK